MVNLTHSEFGVASYMHQRHLCMLEVYHPYYTPTILVVGAMVRK